MHPTLAEATFDATHRATMAVIKRCPVGRQFALRAYNHALKRFGGEHTARTFFGAWMRCDLDDLVSRTIFYFGCWEPNNSRVVGEALRRGDVVLDIGANIGYYTLLTSGLVGPDGQVVAIEAAPSICAQLKSNIELNGATNVRVMNVAASDRHGELAVYGGTKWNRGATSTTKAAESAQIEGKVQAVPVDALLSEDEWRRLAFVKIDIEGGELPVLRQLLSVIERCPQRLTVMAELSPDVGGEELEAVFDRMLAAGFEAFAIENHYDVDWYLRWRRPVDPVAIERMPRQHTDVFFMRRDRRTV